MHRILRHLVAFIALISFAFLAKAQDCGCDHVITPPVERVTTLIIKGDSIGVKAGQTVCLQAGFYMQIRFLNFRGEPGNPVTIQNCGGQVNIGDDITYGRWWAVDLAHSSYVRLTGSGTTGIRYGIKLGRSGDSALKIGASTDTEIDHLEIANANFAGILAKTDYRGNVPPDAPEMNNVNIHDNYVHDTRGEGMYIGETTTPGQDFRHLEIWNNIITRTGLDLLQVANAIEDVHVHHNVMYQSGLRNVLYQNKGLQVGDNCVGQYYNNFVIGSPSNSMIVMGMGNIDIYNNYFQGAGDPGFFVDNRKVSLPGTPIKIRDNYMMEVRETAVFFNIFNELNAVSITGNQVEGSNVLIGTDPNWTTPIVVKDSGNVVRQIERVQFNDVTVDDFTLPENSPYKGIGLLEDVSGRNSRPFISIIRKQTLDAETTRQIGVKAGDADGDALSFETFNMPSFVSFVDNGDGTGAFDIAPQMADIGVYHKVRLRVTDAKGSTYTQTFSIDVRDPYAFIATANASTLNNGPENTLDKDSITRWEGGASSGNFINYDLREDKIINSIQIAFHNGTTKVQEFKVEVSADSIDWERIMSGAGSGVSADLETFTLGGVRGRYLRIVDNGVGPNSYTEVVIDCTTAPITEAFGPSADVYADGRRTYNNTVLKVRGGTALTYMRFDISGLNVGKYPVIDARLKVKAVQSGYGKIAVYMGDDIEWDETSRRDELPGRGRALTSLTANFTAGQVYEFDLGDAVPNNGILNLILLSSNAKVTIAFSSSETSTPPQVVVLTLRGGLPETGDATTMMKADGTSEPAEVTSFEQEVKIYPNPFQDQIMVDLPEDTGGTVAVEILDRSGRHVYDQSWTSPGTSLVLNMQNLQLYSGMYILKLKQDGYVVKTLRVFKR